MRNVAALQIMAWNYTVKPGQLISNHRIVIAFDHHVARSRFEDLKPNDAHLALGRAGWERGFNSKSAGKVNNLPSQHLFADDYLGERNLLSTTDDVWLGYINRGQMFEG